MERLAKLEGKVSVVTTVVGSLFIIVLAVMLWRFDQVDRRMDTLERKVDAIPGKLTELSNAIASNITAAQAPTPVVIYTGKPPPPATPKEAAELKGDPHQR